MAAYHSNIDEQMETQPLVTSQVADKRTSSTVYANSKRVSIVAAPISTQLSRYGWLAKRLSYIMQAMSD